MVEGNVSSRGAKVKEREGGGSGRGEREVEGHCQGIRRMQKI